VGLLRFKLCVLIRRLGKVGNGVLRENSLGFTLFLMVLTQASHQVQLQVLEDLNALAMHSLRNVRVMV